ncbi:MAG: serine--tRNA ligase [SAR86 cluster bacterium SAR86B]|uniref:Serine--tRNA ligase n=1 Tax=SAR86 cluster bacterium SAR86B TaxID=1123867 RepID=J4KSG9_9GAMM|nr:MAG: serine--tRNA ligase [SAR86 cluster bacterium SAR86B]
MLDIKYLRQNAESIKQALLIKGFELDIDTFNSLENNRKSLQVEVESLQAERKELSSAFGQAKAKGEDVDELSKKIEINSNLLKEKEDELKPILVNLEQFLLEIPNLPDPSTPEGSSDIDNKIIRNWGDINKKKGLDHLEITSEIDTELAAILAGSRFSVLSGKIAKLHRALIQFMLDEADENGYEEYYVPFITNKDSLTGTGQLPKFEEDLFKLTDGRYLISTAEIPLTNLFNKKTIDLNDLPIKVTAHTPCFRSEAGSYGKDTRGLIRQHQFEKVELVQVVHPEQSENALEELLLNAETILQKLNLPYQVVQLCGGDLGFSSSKTFDIEVWLPSQEKYREISSCSNFTDFQSRRANIKIKDENSKIFAHTINGSGLAVGRTLIAVIENYYDEVDKVINIPDALKKYLTFDTIST